MSLVLADRVQETSATTGTGTLTLAGAVLSYQTFATGIGSGNTCYYTITNAAGSWEVGIGTVGTGTLARTTVLSSSNAGALVSFTGTLNVFVTYPAGRAVYQDESTGTAYSPALAASNGLTLNNATVSANYTIPTGYNAVSAGPVTINAGIVVTVPSGSVWAIV